MARSMLVVDDTPMMLDLLVDLFSDLGFEVHAAGTAADAHEQLQRDGLSVVVVDFGILGREGLPGFVEQCPVPVLVLSGDPTARTFAEEVADGFAVKGDDLGELIDKVEQLAAGGTEPDRPAADGDVPANG